MSVNVVFGKPAEPAKFYHKKKRVSVDAAFEMYRNNARFVVGGKTLNVNRFGTTQDIHEAAENGNHQLVADLAENGADLNLKGKNGWAPAHRAAGGGYDKVMQVLADYGADLNIGISDSGATPALISAEVGTYKVMQILADEGADLDLSNEYGETPLIMAVGSGHLETVRVLVNEGANVDLTDRGDAGGYEDEDGWFSVTPLWHAAKQGHHKIVRVLVENGANLDAVGQFGYTPVFVATKRGHRETVRVLADMGANLNLGTKKSNDDDIERSIESFDIVSIPKGATPVWMAAYTGRTDIVRLLATKGANLDRAMRDLNVFESAYVVDLLKAYERRRIGRDKRHVRSVARQIGLPEDMEGVIGSLLKSNI